MRTVLAVAFLWSCLISGGPASARGADAPAAKKKPAVWISYDAGPFSLSLRPAWKVQSYGDNIDIDFNPRHEAGIGISVSASPRLEADAGLASWKESLSNYAFISPIEKTKIGRLTGYRAVTRSEPVKVEESDTGRSYTSPLRVCLQIALQASPARGWFFLTACDRESSFPARRKDFEASFSTFRPR